MCSTHAKGRVSRQPGLREVSASEVVELGEGFPSQKLRGMKEHTAGNTRRLPSTTTSLGVHTFSLATSGSRSG